MKQKINKYGIIIFAVGLFILGAIWDFSIARSAARTAGNSLIQLVVILPPIFILMGLLDVWVPKETLIKFMGQDSGIRGPLLGFFLGSAAAGPLYISFPIAAMLLKKGASLTNVIIFVGAWSTTKIPLLMFELTAMGPAFTLARLLINIPVIIIIAFSVKLALKPEEEQALRRTAEGMLE